MARREFTRKQREAIVERAKNGRGEICCECCRLALVGKPYEIDHCIPEGLLLEAAKKQPLAITDGQLLGKACCHRGENGKTRRDITRIAKAKRQKARHEGTRRPRRKIPAHVGGIPSRGFDRSLTRKLNGTVFPRASGT